MKELTKDLCFNMLEEEGRGLGVNSTSTVKEAKEAKEAIVEAANYETQESI